MRECIWAVCGTGENTIIVLYISVTLLHNAVYFNQWDMLISPTLCLTPPPNFPPYLKVLSEPVYICKCITSWLDFTVTSFYW